MNAAPRPAPTLDVAALIESQIGRLIRPGDVHELRVLGVTRPGETPRAALAGYFDDPATLARAAAALDGYARGIYFTLNPLRPELLERAPNRLDPRAACATDADVLRRRWLPLDLDPVRPKDTNATEDELAAAIVRADAVWLALRSRGWGDPFAAFSGNGVHLLYPIDLEPGDTAVRDALRWLSKEWSAGRVKLDPANHNASRIWKCYGTTTRKGPATTDRPHRRAYLLPDVRGVASLAGPGAA